MTADPGSQPDLAPTTIDAGLPQYIDRWPDGTLEALKNFVQGHVVERPPLFYFADPSRPVWIRTHAYTEDSEGPETIELPQNQGPPYGLITTQTCDISEEDADLPIRPWVQLSPIYDRSSDLDSGWRKKLRRGGGPLYLLHVPALPDGFWVADFRIEMPMEKGWLAAQTPVDGFGDETARRKVGERIAILRSRPAFAPRFIDLIQRPLIQALKTLRSKNPALFESMDEREPEVAVELDSFLDPRVARVTLLVSGPVSEDIKEWWSAWWDETSERCESSGLTLQPFAVRETSQVTLAEYRRMTTVPLTRISPD